MDEWVTTKEASDVKKVGLTQHRIAEMARHREIVARKPGEKKWLVKVEFNNDKYELVKSMALEETKQAQRVTEQLSTEIGLNTPLTEHFDQVSKTAKLLASRVQKLLYYRNSEDQLHVYEGNIVDGLRFFGSRLVLEEIEKKSIEPHLARCVFAHYEDKFAKLPYNYWEEVTMENVSQELADNLLRLAHSKGFKPCPTCPACQEIAGIEHMSEDSIPIYDEKTNEILHEAPDWF